MSSSSSSSHDQAPTAPADPPSGYPDLGADPIDGMRVLRAPAVPTAVVRVKITGDKASEEARYPTEKRIRAIAEAPDGALLVLEDGPGGRLLRLSRP